MKTIGGLAVAVALAALLAAASVEGRPCFGYRPAWESADDRATLRVALADFNGDGWQNVTAETKDGDGESHVYYLEQWPALTIKQIKINGQVVPRSDYCFDARAGWYSFKEAPERAALIAVDYVWSNRLDLFAANEQRTETDGRDAVYFNEDGTFNRSPGWLAEKEDEPWSVAEADFDADGDVDVAIGGVEFVKIYKNTGSGLETTPSWNYEVAPSWVYCGLAWGDVDNDGYLELAVTDLHMRKASVFKNNGGTLENSPSWEVVNGYYLAPAWGDMDGDGDMDLAFGTFANTPEDDGRLYVYKNVGGVLETTPSWRNEGPEARCMGTVWGDVNGDGWLDLVKGMLGAASGLDYYADIYISQNGVLPTTPSWESEFYGFNHDSWLVDADRDGFLDLIQDIGNGICGYFRKGGALEKYPSWLYVAGAPYSIQGFRVGDVNGDGYPDVAAGCTCSTGRPRGAPNKLFLNKGNIGINVKGFAASACPRGVALRWDVSEAVAGFNLYRDVKSGGVATEPARINDDLITGRSPYRYVDAAAEAGNTYYYWLEVVPLSGPAERHGPAECTAGVKAAFALSQNRPNPVRAATTFAFSVPTACDATLAVYDIAGRRVATPYAGVAAAGENEVAVDVSALAPGVYTYRLEAGGATATKRMVVVR